MLASWNMVVVGSHSKLWINFAFECRWFIDSPSEQSMGSQLDWSLCAETRIISKHPPQIQLLLAPWLTHYFSEDFPQPNSSLLCFPGWHVITCIWGIAGELNAYLINFNTAPLPCSCVTLMLRWLVLLHQDRMKPRWGVLLSLRHIQPIYMLHRYRYW